MDSEPLRSNGYIYKETVEMEEYFLQLPRGTLVLMEIEVVPLSPDDDRDMTHMTPEEVAALDKVLEEFGAYPSRWAAEEE